MSKQISLEFVPSSPVNHDDAIKWKDFPRYWPFVLGIHRSPMNSPHKGQWRGALMFFFNQQLSKNGDADELRRHTAHDDVIVMDITTDIADNLNQEWSSSLPHTCVKGGFRGRRTPTHHPHPTPTPCTHTHTHKFLQYCIRGLKIYNIVIKKSYLKYIVFEIYTMIIVFEIYLYNAPLVSLPARLSNHMPCKAGDEITYPFPNFNGCSVDVWEHISNFNPHFIMSVINYSCSDKGNSRWQKGPQATVHFIN